MHKSDGRSRYRLALISDLCRGVKICEGGCGDQQPNFSLKGIEIKAEWIDANNCFRKGKEEILSAERVHAIFKRIGEIECTILGMYPQLLKQDWMIVTALPVPLFLNQQKANQVLTASALQVLLTIT